MDCGSKLWYESIFQGISHKDTCYILWSHIGHIGRTLKICVKLLAQHRIEPKVHCEIHVIRDISQYM